MKRRLSEETGFTLIELLVVMGIILILVSIAMPALNVARNKARNTEVKSGCNQIQTALEQFAVTHGGNYPGAHWEQDSAGDFYVGPGVIGALPSYDGTTPRKDFYVAKVDLADGSERDPYFTDPGGSGQLIPNVEVIDALVTEGYLTDYPANPFLRATGGTKSQMGNLFLFNPLLGDTTPIPSRQDTLDWNRYTLDTRYGSAYDESMRKNYLDFARGHFTYIPLSPVNNTGYDYVGEWDTGVLTDAQLSDYFKRCRGYILIGWGHSRLEDEQAKGVSEKYWNTTVGAFDFDNSLSADELEVVLSDTGNSGLVYPEMLDSADSVGAYGGTLPGGGPDIDQAFFGATFFKITGS